MKESLFNKAKILKDKIDDYRDAINSLKYYNIYENCSFTFAEGTSNRIKWHEIELPFPFSEYMIKYLLQNYELELDKVEKEFKNLC